MWFKRCFANGQPELTLTTNAKILSKCFVQRVAHTKNMSKMTLMTTTNNTSVNLTELQLFCVLESPLAEGAFFNKINSKQLMKIPTKMLHNLHAWFWTVINNNNKSAQRKPQRMQRVDTHSSRNPYRWDKRGTRGGACERVRMCNWMLGGQILSTQQQHNFSTVVKLYRPAAECSDVMWVAAAVTHVPSQDVLQSHIQFLCVDFGSTLLTLELLETT